MTLPGIRLGDVVSLLEGQLLDEGVNRELVFETACGADLMSDVLAFVHSGTLLLSGLTHPQVIRVAEMVDVAGVVFVRGKVPPEETLALAREARMPVVLTPHTLFEACGRLYGAGLEACDVRGEARGRFAARLHAYRAAVGASGEGQGYVG